jgi:hypothetical protein
LSHFGLDHCDLVQLVHAVGAVPVAAVFARVKLHHIDVPYQTEGTLLVLQNPDFGALSLFYRDFLLVLLLSNRWLYWQLYKCFLRLWSWLGQVG